MEVQLKVVVGNSVGQVLKVPGPKFFVGRAEDCHLRPGSDLVSRHHCVIMVEGSTAVVRDFGSKNGTFVNGERITTETPLQNGDRLKIGPLEFEVVVTESLAGAKRPKVTSIKEAAVRTAESGSNADLDIDALLGSDDADAGDTRELRRSRSGDTTELDAAASDTAVFSPKPAAAPEPSPSPPPAETPEASQPAEKQEGDRKVLGKPQGFQAKRIGNDSKDAAAEMLKRLRRR